MQCFTGVDGVGVVGVGTTGVGVASSGTDGVGTTGIDDIEITGVGVRTKGVDGVIKRPSGVELFISELGLGSVLIAGVLATSLVVCVVD